MGKCLKDKPCLSKPKGVSYSLAKTITISKKVFSAFSHPIKDTNCADFSNLNYILSILLVFFLEKSASFEKF